MNANRPITHSIFLIGIVGKGINALLEIVGGLLLYFLSNSKIVNLIASLTHGEFVEDPRDKISLFLIRSAENLSVGGRLYGSIYLLSHGIIKLIIIKAPYLSACLTLSDVPKESLTKLPFFLRICEIFLITGSLGFWMFDIISTFPE